MLQLYFDTMKFLISPEKTRGSAMKPAELFGDTPNDAGQRKTGPFFLRTFFKILLVIFVF